MARGGKRPNAGRRPGTLNKRSDKFQEAVKEAAAVVEGALPEAFHGDAHALLMWVYKDTTQPVQIRIDAAGKAIKFEKPALQSIEASGKDGGPLVINVVQRG